jgi:peptide/nickel transport system substrate-binding protein
VKQPFAKFVVLVLSLLLIAAILLSCQKQATTLPKENGEDEGKTSEEPAEKTEGQDEKQAEETPEQVVKPDDYQPTVNKEKVLTLTWGTWPKPPQFQGNPFTQGGVGMAGQYVFEPLLQFTRSTDYVHKRLATSVEHTETESIVKLRDDVTWNDGEKFTADDVIAALYLNPRTICNYISKVEKVNDYEIKFVWLQPAPFNELRELMIAQGGTMNVPYHIYKEYVDKAKAIYEAAEDASPEEIARQRTAFGKKLTEEQQNEINENWNEMMKMTYPKPIGTGPFVVETVTASDLVLIKRKDYWAADQIYFEKIHHVMATSEAQLAMLRNATTDSYPGSLPRDLAESILASNDDIVFYPMFDPACHVLFFNQRRKPFDDVNFRRALVYALDRKKIREGANYYGKEFPISIAGIPPSSIATYVSEEMQAKLTKYEYNLDMAAKILEEKGWKRNAEGIWEDKDGKTYSFTIAVNAGWQPAGVVDTAASIAAEQLKAFGFPTEVIAVDSSVYWNNAAVEGMYDMAIDWGDVTWGFMYPWSALDNTFKGGPSELMGLPRNPDTNRVEFTVKGPDGTEVNPVELVDRLPVISDEAERNKIIDTLVWICNENAYGVNLYQNTTGVWENRKHVIGLPMEDEIDKYNQFMPIGRTPEEVQKVAELNWGFCGIQKIWSGDLKPR